MGFFTSYMSIKSTLIGWLGLAGLDEVVTYINRVLNGNAEYSNYSSDAAKLKVIFSNPALMKVFSLQCDLFSLGKVYVYKDGKEIDSDAFLDMIKKPNPFQRQSQLLWDYMFWNMIGNTYCYVESRIPGEDNMMYILQNDKITFTPVMDSYKDAIVLSSSMTDEINDLTLIYSQTGRKDMPIKWDNIIHVPDLTNGTGDWFQGRSRLDALYKVISNSEASLDAKNINIRYSGKFMVAGQADPENTTHEMMGEEEKKDIESKMNGRKSVHAVKSMIDIKRFVDNIANLKLDESFLADYFLIGAMYGIPKDVLEAYNSSTYENQEKARGAHVSYCLQPKGNVFFEGLTEYFGYTQENKEIIIDWEHLPFMQAFAKERAETERIRTETLNNLMDAGVPIEEINEYLDTNFKKLDYERQRVQTRQNNRESNTNT